MPGQKGKDLLLKMDDGAGFVTVAGLRSKTLAFNAQTVDVTHAESARRRRELPEGDLFVVTAGCDIETCRSKFANAANFRGFPAWE